MEENNINEQIENLQKELSETRRRQREYRNAGAYEQEAQESANASRLVEEIANLRAQNLETPTREANNEVSVEEQIENLQKELSETRRRQREYRNAGAYEQEAQESANASRLVEEIANLRAQNLETPTREANNEVSVEEQIENLQKELSETRRRQREYRNAGAYEQEAQESANASRLVEEIANLRAQNLETPTREANNEVSVEEQIENLQKELSETRRRQREYRNAGAYEQEAQESANASRLVEEIANLRAQNLETPTREANNEKPKTETSTRSSQNREDKYEKLRKEKGYHEKLTNDQIDELIAEGIEPGDPEYYMYLGNHGIKDDNENAKNTQTKAGEPVKPQEPIKTGEPTKPENPIKPDEPIKPEQEDYCNISFDAKESLYNITYRINGKDGEIHSKLNKELFSSRRKVKDAAIAKLLDGKYVEVFEGFDRNKIKHYDAKLIAILFARFGKEDPAKGIEACRKYLTELEKGANADKTKLPYKMKYDVASIKETEDANGNKLNLFERLAFMRMARKNEHVAEVTPERKKINWKAIGAGLLAIGATALVAVGLSKGEEKEKLPPAREVIDMGDNETTTTSAKTTATQARTTTTPTQTKTTTTTWKEQLQVQTTTTEPSKDKTTETEIADLIEDFKLGSVVELGDGVNYTENSLGSGDKGAIGDIQWRPAGKYMIDGVSFVKDGQIKDFKYDVDPDFDLLSYIKDNTKNGEEVKFHINQGTDYTRDEKGNYEGSKKTGWIDSEVVLKHIKQKQQEKEVIDINIDK